jgi:hypothetical protein
MDSATQTPDNATTDLICYDPAAEFHQSVKKRVALQGPNSMAGYTWWFIGGLIGAVFLLILMPDSYEELGSRWYENREKLPATCGTYLAITVIGLEGFFVNSLSSASEILNRESDAVDLLRRHMRFWAENEDKEHAMYFFLRQITDPNLPDLYNFDQLSSVKVLMPIAVGNLIKICWWQIIGAFINEEYSTFVIFVMLSGMIEIVLMARLGWFWAYGRIARTIRRECLHMSTPVDAEKAFGIKHTPEDHLASYLEFLMVDKKGSEEAQRKERVCLKVLLEEINVPASEGTPKE